ncbi:50S ribosomal protein L39e [bacterium]|nr:50S ribosomal protein L39e [bacterium]
MARHKHYAKKRRLIKANNNTKWAPYFAIIKKYGIGKKVHPSKLSQKRSWRRNKLKV